MNDNLKVTHQDNNPDLLTIIGIGASAGGIDALKTFFSHVPKDSGLAFVLVVHLSPDYKSVLAELLQPHVKMPVLQVTKTIPLEPNHVYVIPPNANLNTIDTHLRLSELEERRRDRAPIDHFFRTLAKTHGGNSIGIILTGTGSDGTLGIKEIKAQGGLTVAQDPYEAEFDGMPQSAIATGLIDLVLPLMQIPEFIIRFVTTQPQLPLLEAEQEGKESQLIQQIFAQIRVRTRRDFSAYKLSTILRRLQRRMQLYQVERLEEYLNFLQKSPEEARALSDDFLINVTNFFRDPEVFSHLEENVIPQLFNTKNPGEQFRVWSAGCASGEEAYSLAILLTEEANRRQISPQIQVFASDLHEQSLQKARDGFYPGDIRVDISQERLQNFFTKEDGGYRIRKELREMVIFTPHNLLGDPPFSRIDLIVCRNLLIYLKREVQRNIYELFHYSLHAGGFLVLGPSEHLESADLFSTENKKRSIYVKRNVVGLHASLPVFYQNIHPRITEETSIPKNQPSLQEGELHHKVLERYALPSLLLDADYQVIHLSENVGRYLVYPGGKLNRDVFKMVRPEIRKELRVAIYAAQEKTKLIRTQPIIVPIEGQMRQLIILARIAQEPYMENGILLMFEEYDEPDALQEQQKFTDSTLQIPVKEMEAELQLTRQQLQTVIEKYESSREEMKTSNQDLQYANEELRSTMEELESSKEELQSMNEELTTLNQENRHKVEELGQLSDDLQNLLGATDIATLFLDQELRILRFTPKLSKLFNVRLADRGRVISDITHKLAYDDLIADARKVLDTSVPLEREIEDDQERYYLCGIRPYQKNGAEGIKGVVIIFIEITALKEANLAVQQSEKLLQSILNQMPSGVSIAEAPSGKILFYNEEANRLIRYPRHNSQDFTEPRQYGALHQDGSLYKPEEYPIARALSGEVVYQEEMIYRRVDGTLMTLSMNAAPVRNEHGMIVRAVSVFHDISEPKRIQQALQKAKDEAEESAKAKEEFLSSMSHEIRTPLNAIIGLTNLLLKKDPRPEQMENLSTLKFSSQNLLNLINDILDYSKLEADKVALEAHHYGIKTLINSIKQSYQPLAEEKKNTLKFEISDQVPEVLHGDSHKLAQILNNLISNAVKFTEKGSVSLLVTLLKQEGPEVDLHFAVRDTGVGISKEKIQKIFDKFTQADSSTVRRYGGTGLGLSITKSLLQLMGSEIEAESEEGIGSVFYFSLRQRIGDKENVELVEDLNLKDKQEALSRAKPNIRILLVDDEPFNRLVLQQHLQEWWQLQADEATNGQEAIEKAQQNKYDLILMDIRMPEMDGVEASQLIRQLDKYFANIPIIALTADTSLRNLKEGNSSVFNGIITKPFEPQQLMKLIYPYIVEQEATESNDVKINAEESTKSIQPDFERAERPFKGEKEKKKKFYETALQSLQSYQTDYLDALEKGDITQLSNVMHKAKMLFSMLGLESFYQKMSDTRARRTSGVPWQELQDESKEIQKELEQLYNRIERYLEHLI
ncbi:CheR family methyltransferase [Catalinimonas niigatensis]|uniref:CheR family methyltransferase n=1 Tax=Catalinimonas niigatensis TaxID=1397264 RepID=UPI002665C610|nr:CheR family methyltransferase [Catalinimonas niigatensis]WPP48678.1 CheR family methyltransferase [Catalinimonas niigatensis]